MCDVFANEEGKGKLLLPVQQRGFCSHDKGPHALLGVAHQFCVPGTSVRKANKALWNFNFPAFSCINLGELAADWDVALTGDNDACFSHKMLSRQTGKGPGAVISRFQDFHNSLGLQRLPLVLPSD